jgi:hypothetical protein
VRKLIFALAIAAGLAAPMAVPANAGQMCTTHYIGGGQSVTYCN